MTDVLDLRTRQIGDHTSPQKPEYVLCWVQQALRAHDNPVIEAALREANSLGLPLLVYHGLDNRYPYASHRLHRFILEASRDLERDLSERGIRMVRYVRRPEHLEEGLVYRLCERAASLFTDDEATYVARWQAARVARRAVCPVYVVDASLLVPRALWREQHMTTTRKFRSFHKSLREQFFDALPIQAVEQPRYERDFAWHDPLPKNLDALITRCDVDMSLPPAPNLEGSRDAAMQRLDALQAHVLDRYNFERNNAALPHSTSRLSPYLHFGVVSPGEVVRRVNATKDVHAAARSKFLDELLTWREYAHHRAAHVEHPASWVNLPVWALDTLVAHQYDTREDLYTLDELLHGLTHDEVWNAAQKQFLIDGWMHNNLRMYWGKQIIGWCKSPRIAWMTACYLNDRLSLDGRDPSTYAGLRWCFGESKRGYSEQPVYGFVPKKGARAMYRKKGFKDWLAAQHDRHLEVAIPQELEAVSRAMGYLAE